MRQKDDDTYKTILANLRVGTVSDADTNILKTRVIKNFHNPGERYKLTTYTNFVITRKLLVMLFA